MNAAPTTTPRRGLVNAVRIAENSGISARGASASFIISMPYIRTAKPTIIEPALRLRSLLAAIISKIPINATTGEKDSGLSILIKIFSLSMPASDRIHAVRVVPILEPMITPIVCPSSMIPEFTRPTSMTVIAEEDWMAIVIPAPKRRLLMGLLVIFLRSCSNLPPAIFSRPEDMTDIP